MDFTLSKKKIREIFKKGVRASERTLLPEAKKYDYPWVVLLNEGKEDDRIPIESINLMRSRASKNLDGSKSFYWHYFSKGLVLEFSSSALREEDELVKEDIKWTEFLKLCNQYRPRRPIDAIAISVPAKLLSDSANSGSSSKVGSKSCKIIFSCELAATTLKNNIKKIKGKLRCPSFILLKILSFLADSIWSVRFWCTCFILHMWFFPSMFFLFFFRWYCVCGMMNPRKPI